MNQANLPSGSRERARMVQVFLVVGPLAVVFYVLQVEGSLVAFEGPGWRWCVFWDASVVAMVHRDVCVMVHRDVSLMVHRDVCARRSEVW